MGNKILEQIKYLPKYGLKVDRKDEKVFTLVVTLDNAMDLGEKLTVNRNSIMHLLVGDSDNNVILYEKYT